MHRTMTYDYYCGVYGVLDDEPLKEEEYYAMLELNYD